MPSKRSRVPVTLAVRSSDGRGDLPVPVRVLHSAEVPTCPKCESSENVVRIWHGGQKMWACSVHYKITSTKKKEATLLQRVTHRLPQADQFELREVLPNRQYRRRRTG